MTTPITLEPGVYARIRDKARIVQLLEQLAQLQLAAARAEIVQALTAAGVAIGNYSFDDATCTLTPQPSPPISPP